MSEQQQESVEETSQHAVQQTEQEEAQTQEEVDYKAQVEALTKEKEKLLGEVHRYKSTARELESKSRSEQERILREKGEWQKIAEMKEEELNDLRQREEKIKESLVNREKFSALKEAALKKGIRPEAINDLELFGMDGVEVETTSTGRVNVLGVDAAIEQLKLRRPYMFGGARTSVNGNAPIVNNQASGLVTVETLNKLSKEARKTGDYAAYEKAHKQYRQQQK